MELLNFIDTISMILALFLAVLGAIGLGQGEYFVGGLFLFYGLFLFLFIYSHRKRK